ncbi:hypothetical protein JB92DRAFT_3112734 [Gautieria morchelliformis]|nr:hypothetical protein JB92DRAFT_3112734 [Gautieria morchelliformis]
MLFPHPRMQRHWTPKLGGGYYHDLYISLTPLSLFPSHHPSASSPEFAIPSDHSPTMHSIKTQSTPFTRHGGSSLAPSPSQSIPYRRSYGQDTFVGHPTHRFSDSISNSASSSDSISAPAFGNDSASGRTSTSSVRLASSTPISDFHSQNSVGNQATRIIGGIKGQSRVREVRGMQG